ncbi:MAG: hypothetical protein ACO2O5_00890 [Candidatus Caldipriscus sp.]
MSRFISLNVIYNKKLDEKLRPILDIHIKYKFAVLGVDDILEKII